jgi:hypothetical protein
MAKKNSNRFSKVGLAPGVQVLNGKFVNADGSPYVGTAPGVSFAPGVHVQNGQFVNADNSPWAPGQFTPWQPPALPPEGSYDPSIDGSVGAANRGYGDLQDQSATGDTRDTTDYLTGRAAIDQGQARGLADILSARSRGGEDYTRQLGALDRSYGQLANRQRQSQQQAGVALGGASLQAAARRAANQAYDRAPLDTNFQRFTADSATSEQRLGENTTNQLGALNLDLAPPSADNPLGGRRFQDRKSALTIAGRENAQYGIDAGKSRFFQAAGAGYTIPGRGDPGGAPSNEFRDGAGNPYRTELHGADVLRRGPAGNVLSRRKRKVRV